MSRRAPRIRAQLAVTVRPLMGDLLFLAHTRDVSDVGCFLETATELEPGTRVTVRVVDDGTQLTVQLDGEVTRQLPTSSGGAPGGFGVVFLHAPAEWKAIVAGRARQVGGPRSERNRRLRVLVIGDDARQRGALALYVTSGWDVRFASDVETAAEALGGVKMNAVIAEHDADDLRWRDLLAAARRVQPSARRIVRGAIAGAPTALTLGAGPLVHRFVDRDAGLEALLDALTADLPTT